MGSPYKWMGATALRGLGLLALGGTLVAGNDQVVTPWELQQGDAFGSALALTEDWLLVGEPRDDIQGMDSGSAAAFRGTYQGWVQKDLLKAPDGRPGDRFGASVSISGDLCAVGAPQSQTRGWRSGAVYLFRLQDSVWTHLQTLHAPNAAPGDNFGHAVALEGDTLAVGARFVDGRESDSGAVFLFGLPHPVDNAIEEAPEEDEGKLVFHQRLRAPREFSGGEFGFSVDLHGNQLAVGSWGAIRDGLVCGAAYLYAHEQGAWRLQKELWAPLPEDGACFGLSVALGDSRLAIGAPWENNGEGHAGGAYVWAVGSDGWEMEVHLEPRKPRAEGCFGIAVALDTAGERMLVGSRRGSPRVTGAGSASYYQAQGKQWIERRSWQAPVPRAGDDFGLALAVDATQALIGARRGNSDGGDGHGGCLFKKSLASGR